MRAIVTILAIVVVLLIVGVATGFVDLHGRSGSLPTVSGGSLPTVKADVGSIDLGSKNKVVEVPKVETKKTTVEVPTLSVNKPN